MPGFFFLLSSFLGFDPGAFCYSTLSLLNIGNKKKKTTNCFYRYQTTMFNCLAIKNRLDEKLEKLEHKKRMCLQNSSCTFVSGFFEVVVRGFF